MLPLRLVFLAISSSMIFSSAVFGGESPNEDRIGDILSAVYSMRDRMENLVKNVEKIETKVNNIDTMEEITAEKVSKLEDEMVEVVKKTDATDSKISSMQSKINGIKSEVEEVQKNVAWRFIGAGGYTSRDDYLDAGPGFSLAQCLHLCSNKRSSNSKWNGVRFSAKDDSCFCVKNDAGHTPIEGYMHFRG